MDWCADGYRIILPHMRKSSGNSCSLHVDPPLSASRRWTGSWVQAKPTRRMYPAHCTADTQPAV